MPSLARFTERSRAEWSGFQTAAAPHEPYNLESKPGHPRTIPQYRISFEICSILGRCAPPEFWAAKLGHVARMPGPRWAHRAQQRSLRNHVGADASPGIPGKSFYGLGHTKLGPHTLRFPARMQSPAGFTERSRRELNGFRLAATLLGPENLENQPRPPEAAPQYRISFEIGSILGRCAPPPFWAAKLGLLARMLSRAWFSERSRAEPQESSSPGLTCQ